MPISKITGSYGAPPVSKNSANKKIRAYDKAMDVMPKDTVNLSESSMDIQTAKKAVEAAQGYQIDFAARSEKVENLKKLYETGSYEVDAEKTAEKIIGSIFNATI